MRPWCCASCSAKKGRQAISKQALDQVNVLGDIWKLALQVKRALRRTHGAAASAGRSTLLFKHCSSPVAWDFAADKN